MTLDLPEGVSIDGVINPDFEKVLTQEAIAFVADLHRPFNPRREELLAGARSSARSGSTPASCPISCAETRADPRRATGRVAPIAAGPPRPPRRDHRPGRPQDDHQRAELRRQGLHGGLRGCEHAHLGQHASTGQINLRDAVRRRSTSPSRRRASSYKLNEKTADAVRAAARLAPAREARHGRRRADVGLAVRLRPVLLPQRARSCWRAAAARTSTCRRWRAISRRGCGTTCSSAPRTTLGVPQRHDQGHGADRDHPGRVRDGRDPVRAARPLGRAELRPLGLHLQLHQEVPRATGCRPARPRAR